MSPCTFGLADRAGDETGVHDHAAIADVIDLVALRSRIPDPSTPFFQRNLLSLERCRLVSEAQVPPGPANILATRSASASRASTRAAAFLPSSGQSTWSVDVMALDSAGSSGPRPGAGIPGGDQRGRTVHVHAGRRWRQVLHVNRFRFDGSDSCHGSPRMACSRSSEENSLSRTWIQPCVRQQHAEQCR